MKLENSEPIFKIIEIQKILHRVLYWVPKTQLLRAFITTANQHCSKEGRMGLCGLGDVHKVISLSHSPIYKTRGHWSSWSWNLPESKIATVFSIRFKNTMIETSKPLTFVFIVYIWSLQFSVAHPTGLSSKRHQTSKQKLQLTQAQYNDACLHTQNQSFLSFTSDVTLHGPYFFLKQIVFLSQPFSLSARGRE